MDASASGAVIGLGGVLLGAAIAFVTNYVATSRLIQSQTRLQAAAFDRDDAAMRALVLSLLFDTYQYVRAAALHSQFDTLKWEGAVKRLLDCVMRLDFARAFSAEEVEIIIRAAFEADLALVRFRHLANKVSPFSSGFEEKFPGTDVYQAEIAYVIEIRTVAQDAYSAFNDALRVLHHENRIGRLEPTPFHNIIDDFRSRIGRPPVNRP